MAYFVWRKLTRLIMPRATGASMPLPALPLRAVGYTVSIYLLVATIMIPLILARVNWQQLEDTVTRGAFISQLPPAAREVFAAHEFDEPARAGHLYRTPIWGINILGHDATSDEMVWFVEPDIANQIEPSQIGQLVNLTSLRPARNLSNLIQLYMLDASHLLRLHNADAAGGANIEVIVSAQAQRTYLNRMALQIWAIALVLLFPMALILRVVMRRVVLHSLDELFVGLYGRGLVGSPDEIEGGQQIVANVEDFHARLQAHIDEQARLASLGAGTSHLAHDVRNLLASLQLNAEGLQASKGERERRLGERLENSIQQALTLVDWAAMYTSSKRDNLDVRSQPLAPVIDEVVNFVRLHDPRREVQLVNKCPKNLNVAAERTLLFRVLFNLTLNAVQALKNTRDDKKKNKLVQVTAQQVDDNIEISVSDNGPGLPKEGRHDLLMPHVSQTTPTGTGLGLKIATDLVSWHGGQIRLDRSDERGTKFVIMLPTTPRHSNDDDPMLTAIDPVSATG